MLAAGLLEEAGERPDPEMNDERRRYCRLTVDGERATEGEAKRLQSLGAVGQIESGAIQMMFHRLPTLLYPKSFRDQYQGLMEQVFRDQMRNTKHPRRHWLNTLFDVVKNAPYLQWEAHMQSIASILGAIMAAFVLARFELHSDDTGVEVAFVFLFTFALGFWQPKHAKLFSFIGLGIPLAEVGWGGLSIKKAAMILLFVMVVSVAGTVSGMLVRLFATKRLAR